MSEIALTPERKEPRARIAIALVSHETVPVTFAYDLANLLAYTTAALPDDIEIGVNLIKGTYVHTARQEMIVELLSQRVTHICWIDTDMRFPKDALVRLLKHNKRAVGINYSQRGIPPNYVAIKVVGNDEKLGHKLQTLPDSTGLEEVEGIGFGLFLLRADACANMPDPSTQPWFGFEYLPKRRQWVGEDIYFCNLLRASGQTIFVDHDLSKECAHTGSFEFKLEHVAAWGEGEK